MSPRSARPAVLAGVLALVVTACGDRAPDVGTRGAIDPVVAGRGDLEVSRVQLPYPPDGVYDVGEDAELQFGVTSTGDLDDALVDVRGADFAGARLTVDGRPGVIRVPADATVRVGAGGVASVVLRDVRTSVRPAESLRVTLVFQEAGDVPVDAVVAAEGEEGPPSGAADPAAGPSG